LLHEVVSRTKQEENGEIEKILSVLAMANSPAPLGYISFHTGIKEPLEALRRMAERDLVRQCTSSTWSCSKGPMFEVTPTARENLY